MTNPFVQGQQMLMQQIPFDQLLAHPQIAPEQINLVGVQMSANMAPYYAHVVAYAAREIQQKASLSAPRIYAYNVLAANGFNNASFHELVTKLAQLIEMVVIAQNQPPQNVIPSATEAYISYRVAQLAMTNPVMVQAMHAQQPQMLAALQNTMVQFENMVRAMSERRGVAQQQQPATVQMAPVGGLFSNAGTVANTDIFSNNPVFQNQQPQAGSSVLPTSMTVEKPFAPQPVTPVSQATAIAQPIQSNNVFGATVVSQPAATTAAQPMPSAGPKQITRVVEDTSLWYPTKANLALPTYDPNKEELKLHVYSDGSIQPVIAQKTSMDREAHLAPLTITPKWVTMSAARTGVGIPEGRKAPPSEKTLTSQDIHPIAYPEAANTSMTNKEGWLVAEAYLLANRHRFSDKALLVQAYNTQVDTLVVSKALRDLLWRVQNSDNMKQAAEMLAQGYSKAMRQADVLDVRALKRVIARLTDATNRFTRLNMSLPFGQMSDYLEDALEIEEFINKKLGEGAVEVLQAAHRRIVQAALNIAEDELAQAITLTYFNKAQLPDDHDLCYAHLISHVAYAVVDINTVQLRAQVPQEGYSALVSESSTPLLSFLAGVVMDRKTAQEKGGPGFEVDRYLLRTNDGVVLEFVEGAMASNATMVGLYKGD